MTSEILHVDEAWKSSLCCPRCHSPLVAADQPPAMVCQLCSARHPVVDGIGQFADLSDFYEREGFVSSGSDFGDGAVGRLKLHFARHHYLQDMARHVPRGARVVEIGCGGGSRYLARNYRMLGVDLSQSSARQAAGIYGSVVRGDCTRLPLADGSVDAVVSSFILEHFEGDSFGRFFAEMQRVLRPGGCMVHYFDLANDAPFTRWAIPQPWYHALFVEERGHHCLRVLPEWERGFAAAGFTTLSRRFSCKTWLQDLSIWGRLGDPRVRGVAGGIGRAVRLATRVGGRSADVAMCLYQDAFERFHPDAWASKVIWVAKKT